MAAARLCKTCFAILLALAPAGAFAQEAGRQVALIPFWGEDPAVTAEFEEELFLALSVQDGFLPRRLNPAALPLYAPPLPPHPEALPPFVLPGALLVGEAPLAMTGEVFLNPFSNRWHMRVYLWRMIDERLLFSEEFQAANRQEASMILPFMLQRVFSFMPPDFEEPAPVIVEVPVEVIVPRGGAPQPIIIGGQQVIIHQAAPPRRSMLYAGIRAGGNLQMFAPLSWGGGHQGFESAQWESVSAAAHAAFMFHSFRMLDFGLQIEGVATQDFGAGDAFTLSIPALLRITARMGTSSLSLLGGAYLLLPLGSAIGSDASEPGIKFGHADERIGPMAGWGYAVGFGLGSRLGPGSLFIDTRWSHDMFSSKMVDYFRRGTISVSVGYELGFLRRR